MCDGMVQTPKRSWQLRVPLEQGGQVGDFIAKWTSFGIGIGVAQTGLVRVLHWLMAALCGGRAKPNAECQYVLYEVCRQPGPRARLGPTRTPSASAFTSTRAGRSAVARMITVHSCTGAVFRLFTVGPVVCRP